MKYSKALTTLVLSSALGLSAVAQEAPSVVIASTATKEQYLKMINILNNATAYSLVTSKVLNGSGNNSFVPIKTTKPVAQILDEISYFDLYFQKNYMQAAVGDVKMDMHLLPYENVIRNYQAVSSKQTDTTVNGLVDAMGQFAKANIKLQTYPELNSAANMKLIRDSQLEAMKERYPVQRSASGGTIDQVKWLVSSYLPISVSAQVDIQGPKKLLKSTFVMPALGYPKLLNQNINGQARSEFGLIPMHFSSKGTAGTIKMPPINSNAAIFTDISFEPNLARKNQLNAAEQAEFDQINSSRALRIELFKDLTKQHVMDMALSFGYLTQNPDSVYAMNVDLPATKENAIKLVKNSDMALVIKGDVLINKDMIANDTIRAKVNDYISSMYDIRLVFHKVHLTMNRIPVQDGALKYLEAPANVTNLNMFLNKDVGFDIKNLKYVPEKSIINVIVSIKPEVKARIENAPVIDSSIAKSADNLLRKNILLNSCVGSFLINTTDRIEDSSLTNCQFIFSSVESFKSQFLTQLINSKVIGILQGELVSSTSYQAGQASTMIDKTIDDIMATIITQMQEAKAIVAERALL